MSRIMKVRKKPVEVEAVGPLTAQNIHDIAAWCGGAPIIEHDSRWKTVYGGLRLPTLEGWMLASINDYVIRGVQGEFYPCKPDIFAATYDQVAEGPDEAH